MCQIKQRKELEDNQDVYLIDGICPDEVKRRLKKDPAIRERLRGHGADALFTVITSDEGSYRDIVSALIELRDGYIKGEFNYDEEKETAKDVQ